MPRREGRRRGDRGHPARHARGRRERVGRPRRWPPASARRATRSSCARRRARRRRRRYGTLSEIALALKAGKPVVGVGTWEIARRERRSRVMRVAGPGRSGRAVLRALGSCPGVDSAAWPSASSYLRTPRPSGGARRRAASRRPYLDALRAYAGREPGAPPRAGPQGRPRRRPAARRGARRARARARHPALTHGIDVGPGAHAVPAGAALAAEAWGAERTLVPDQRRVAGQPRGGLALAHDGRRHRRAAQRALEHDRRADPLRHAAHVHGARARPGARHRALHHAGDARPRARPRRPDAVGATVVSPTYFGAVADVRALADVAHAHGVPLIVDEAWGAHLAFHEDLPEHALAARRRPRRLEHAQDRGVAHAVGDAPPRRRVRGPARRERGGPLRHARRVDQPELAAARLRSTPRGATPPWTATSCSSETMRGAGRHARGHPRDSRPRRARRALRRAPGRAFDYDPLRLAIDVRGTGATRLRARARAARDRRHQPRAGRRERHGRGVRDGRAGAPSRAARLVAALQRAVERVEQRRRPRPQREFAPPPPWGELAMGPREAFFAPQEVVAGARRGGPDRRRVARRLPARRSRTCCPGERLTAETLEYVQQTLELGGSLRGASDRRLDTVRVVAESVPR